MDQSLVKYASANGSLRIGSLIEKAETEQRVTTLTDKQINEGLYYIFSLIGLLPENYPEGPDKVILHNYIRQNLERFSMSDMRAAFLLGIKKKLDCEMNCYERFSPLYLEDVMQAYVRYKFNHRSQIIEAEKEPTPEEQDVIMQRHIIETFNIYKKTKQLIDFGSIKFNYLERKGLIYISEEDTNIAKKQFILNQSKEGRTIRDIINQLKADPADKEAQIMDMAKYITLRRYYKTLIKEGDDIELILKEKRL